MTIVLDSRSGSVDDSIALGRRWRNLGVLTTVGISVQTNTAQSAPANLAPMAYCESLCVFLLLSGKMRYVPETAHVRVHQIWLGDCANDAKATTNSADNLMIVERDIGRLAKYTFYMGGAGDLLSLSLNGAPWEHLHELSRDELRLTNLATTDLVGSAGQPQRSGGRADAQTSAGSLRKRRGCDRDESRVGEINQVGSSYGADRRREGGGGPLGQE